MFLLFVSVELQVYNMKHHGPLGADTRTNVDEYKYKIHH